VLLVIGAYVVGIGMLVKWLSFMPLELALDFGILFHLQRVGRCALRAADELGIATRSRRSAQRSRRARRSCGGATRSSPKPMSDASGLAHQGVALLQAGWLRVATRYPHYHWLCEHVAHWHDSRYSNRLTKTMWTNCSN